MSNPETESAAAPELNLADLSRLTIPQAAQALGITTKTVRRRIAAGTLPATKAAGPNGDQWYVNLAAAEVARTLVGVVVERPQPVDPELVALLILQAMEPLRAEIRALREELAARSNLTVDLPQPVQSRVGRPWWRFW